MQKDPYLLTADTVRESPVSFSERLKFLGPGFILSASIVGSGELIATTALGARAGFVAFWVIVVSCLIKVAIQLEFGRTAILHGHTPMKLFGLLPGRGKWAVWTVFILTLLKVIQVGGMLGGSSLVLYQLFPFVPLVVWALFLAILVALLIFKNYYKLIERASLIMVALFTVFTLVSLFAVNFTEFNFTWQDVLSGLQFHLPANTVIVAIAAFGITGVASDEIIAYNYWCIEKGYASYTGPFENTDAWRQRARGWIRVMQLDAVVAMIIYTMVTAAFYLLGAAILYGRSSLADGNELVMVLAEIYTKTLGSGVRLIYLVGAFFVLFSSVFATLAYWTRLFPDVFGELGWLDFSNHRKRKQTIAWLSWLFPLLWLVAFFFIRLPMIMILTGGLVGSVLLLLVAYAAVWFRYVKNIRLQQSATRDMLLWLSVVSIAVIGVYGLIKILFPSYLP